MKIYCAHRISGLTVAEVREYYTKVRGLLTVAGYTVLSPLDVDGLRPDHQVQSTGYEHPVRTDHAIVERDQWMVHQSDVVYVNLLKTVAPSIGCTMELAWAHDRGKHTVVLMQKDNVHRHAFVLEAADVVFEEERDALRYLMKLAGTQAEAEMDYLLQLYFETTLLPEV